MCRGTPVIDSDSRHVLGAIDGIVVHPDTGRIEAFAVLMPGFLSSRRVYLLSQDIVRWGTAVEIGDADALAPLSEHIRLASLVDGGRPVLGQIMRTQGGSVLGRCADVQFETDSFRAQWLFPRRYFLLWGVAVPISAVLEIRNDAVIVRDTAATVPKQDETPLEMVVTPTAA